MLGRKLVSIVAATAVAISPAAAGPALLFEATTGRAVSRWDRDAAAPLAGRIAGIVSLVVWIAIIFSGRWVGFTSGPDLTLDPNLDLDKLLGVPR